MAQRAAPLGLARRAVAAHALGDADAHAHRVVLVAEVDARQHRRRVRQRWIGSLTSSRAPRAGAPISAAAGGAREEMSRRVASSPSRASCRGDSHLPRRRRSLELPQVSRPHREWRARLPPHPAAAFWHSNAAAAARYRRHHGGRRHHGRAPRRLRGQVDPDGADERQPAGRHAPLGRPAALLGDERAVLARGAAPRHAAAVVGVLRAHAASVAGVALARRSTTAPSSSASLRLPPRSSRR